jgi:hypothetical protein
MKNIKKHRFFELSLLCLIVATIAMALNISRILAGDDAAGQLSTDSVLTTGTEKVSDVVSDVGVAVKDTNSPVSTSTLASTPVTTAKTTPAPVSATPASTSTANKTSPNLKSDSNKSGVTELTPAFTFSSPKDGVTLGNMLKIEGTVSGAKNVEFYLIASDSNTKKYVGTARAQNKNVWNLELDSSNLPNGAFYLLAKIDNAYGTYESSKIKVYVNRLVLDSADGTKLTERLADNPNNTKPTVNQGDSSLPGEANQAGVDKSTMSNGYNEQTSAEWQKKYFESENCQAKNHCGGGSDPDKDGLNNNEEFRYHTDPLNPDSDGDGFLDGDEVKNGFDPLKYSPGDKSDKVVFESPKEKGDINRETYVVKNVEMAKSETGDKKTLKLSGKGLPNSFVNIYIYSTLPIILTVKTDQEGNWSYDLDKQLEDGEHEVYVAVTDNTGKITAKSEPMLFVKTAEAASVISADDLANRTKAATAPTQNRRNSDLILVFIIILLSLGLTLSIMGIITARRAEKEALQKS